LVKKLNKWKISTFVLIIFLALYLGLGNCGLTFATGNAVAEDAIEFINTNLLQGQAVATLGEVTKESGVVKASIEIEGQPSDLYISNDGKLLFPTAIPMIDLLEIPEQPEQMLPEVTTKTDKPVVDLFIMSHCPYGTQAEKGILPVANLLGNNIDFNIKFVYYAMHPTQGEVEEQLNQYCIQKEQNDKFLDYLECFLEDGDGERCLAETGINTDSLTTCTETADEEFEITSNLEDTSSWLSGNYPLFNIHKEENELYSVGGSPTLVVNGEKIERAPRDSVSLLKVICSAFNEAPAECETVLEEGTPGPGFGWSSTGSNNAAQCG